MNREIDSTTLIIGLCLLGGVVILVNAALFAGYRSINSKRLGKSLQKTVQRVRNPWEEEDANLQELSRRVDALKHREPTDPGQDQPPEQQN